MDRSARTLVCCTDESSMYCSIDMGKLGSVSVEPSGPSGVLFTRKCSADMGLAWSHVAKICVSNSVLSNVLTCFCSMSSENLNVRLLFRFVEIPSLDSKLLLLIGVFESNSEP